MILQREGSNKNGTGVLEITTRARDRRSKGTAEAARACSVGEAAATEARIKLAVKEVLPLGQTKLKRSANDQARSDAPESKPI